MPGVKGHKQDAATIAKLKDKFIEYFEDLPIQKYAAQYIGRDEQAICKWKNDDAEFANRIIEAESKFLRKESLKTQAQWKLERLYQEAFPEPTKKTDVTTGGKPIPLLGNLHVLNHDSHPENLPTIETD